MREVIRPVRAAKHRLWVGAFLAGTVQGLLVLAALVILPAAAIRLWEFPWNPFALLSALLLAPAWGLYRLWRARINDAAASVEVDRRFRLAERLSSAYLLRERHDPMVELLKEDASRHAATLQVPSRFPIEPPKRTPIVAAELAAFCAVALWLPPFPKEAEEPVRVVREQPLSEKKEEELAKLLKKREENLRKHEIPEAATGGLELKDPLSLLAEQLKKEKLSQKEAMTLLSEGERELREKKEKLDRIEQARNRIARNLEDQRFTKDVRESLSAGDYEKAAEALKELSSQLASSELSPEDMSKLTRELENLANDLEGNPEIAQAIRDALKGLKESSSGQGSPKLSGENLAKALSGLSKAGASLSELKRLAERSGDLNRLLQDAELAKLALGDASKQCKACGKICSGTMCAKCAGGCNSGMGGPGQGRGNTANPYENPNAGFQDEKVSSAWHPGRILGVVETEAENSPAVSTLGTGVVFVEAGAREQAVVQEEIPPGYEEIVRGYFDRETQPPATSP
ncbi:MAG: hypothetical protein GHCLOJNM_01747 [bacterium]|nr:hypothetical protein [bacterium]